MKKKIDWLNHTLEFMVVLIGILIAFQLNKCSENKSKADLLKSHLNYIEIECKENTQRLAVSIDHIKDQLKNCDSILMEISTSKNINKIRSFSTRLLDMRNIDLVNDSYQVLSQSGDIRYLKNFNQKRRIITLYDSFEKVERINQSNQKLYDNHFYPYLKDNFDLVNWDYVDVKSKEDASKYFSRAFGNTVSTYRYLLLSKLKTYEKEKQMIDAYLNN